MADTYDAPFTWPAGPSEVIITGTFDNWSQSKRLLKSDSGFSIALPLKYGEKVVYKYIVDGQWTTSYKEPTELDSLGNINNAFTAPAKPKYDPPVSLAPAEPLASVPSAPEPTSVPEVAKSALATEGTSSTFGYLASAAGAAIQQLTGIDPINEPKVAIEPIDTKAPDASSSVDQIPLTPAGAVDETPLPTEAAPELPSLVPAASGFAKDKDAIPVVPEANGAPKVAEAKPEPPVPTKEVVAEPPKVVEEPKIKAPPAPEPVAVPAPVTEPTSAPAPTPAPEPKVAPAPEPTAAAAPVATPAPTAAPVTNGTTNGVTHPPRPSTPPPTSTRQPPPGPIHVPSASEPVGFPLSSPSKSHTSSLRKDGTTPRKKRDSFLGKIKHMFHSPTKEKANKLEGKK